MKTQRTQAPGAPKPEHETARVVPLGPSPAADQTAPALPFRFVLPADGAAPAGAVVASMPRTKRLLCQVRPGMALGPYQIGERIGLGGMGVVHRATDRVRSEEVAIKFLIAKDEQRTGDMLARFRQEADVISRMDHPAIVKVRDLDHLDGLDFMVMDLFLGPANRPVNLHDYSHHFGPATGRLEQDDVRAIFRVLLDAVGYAHQQGVVHCDLKPENILFQCLRNEGQYWFAHLKLTDFGLAKIIGEDVVHQSVSESIERVGVTDSRTADVTALVGTFEYMSPEQRRGEPATPASDLYAVGMMIFRLLTGCSEPGLRRPSDLRPGIRKDWDGVILRALREQPDRRFQSAAEMAEAVRSVQCSEPG